MSEKVILISDSYYGKSAAMELAALVGKVIVIEDEPKPFVIEAPKLAELPQIVFTDDHFKNRFKGKHHNKKKFNFNKRRARNKMQRKSRRKN